MKEFYKDFIGVYDNVLNKETCLQIIDYFEKSKNKEIRNKKDIEGRYELDILDEFVELYDPRLVKLVKNKIFQCTHLYRKKYRHFPDCIGVREIQLQKTNPTEGYHVYHMEDMPLFSIKNPLSWHLRKGVYSIYLNDVEEGGETEFLYQKFRLKPKMGTLCLFPAGYTHIHRGNTPFSNTKYIITGWLVVCPDDDNTLKLMQNKNSIISKGTHISEKTLNTFTFKEIF